MEILLLLVSSAFEDLAALQRQQAPSCLSLCLTSGEQRSAAGPSGPSPLPAILTPRSRRSMTSSAQTCEVAKFTRFRCGAGRRRSGRRRAAQQRCGPASLARSSPSPSLRSSPSRRHPPPPASPGRLCARCRHQRCHPSRACRRGSCRQRWLSTSSSASVAVARSREAACLLGRVLRVLRTCARG